MSQAPPPQQNFSAVITAVSNMSSAVSGAIRTNATALQNLQSAIAQIGQTPPETAAQKARRLLQEAEARKQAAIQRRRDMLKRVGGRIMKLSGANAVGRGLRNIGRRITRAASSVFTWGTVITAALAYFVNSPFWNEFKELLADSTKEGGWLNTFIKSVKEFFQPLEGIGKDLLKGEFGKAADKLADFFISLMNRLIDKINKVMPLDMMKIDPFKTTKVKEEETAARKQADKFEAKRIADEGGKGNLAKITDAASSALDKTPIIPALGPFSPTVSGVVEDLGVGTWFDGIATTARKVTGTLLTLETMSDEQLYARQRELADMTDRRYGERGATDLQMSVEDLNKLGKSRMEVLAKFTEETNRRLAGGKRVDPNVPSVTVPLAPAGSGSDFTAPAGGDTVQGSSGSDSLGLEKLHTASQTGASANGNSVGPVVPPPAPPVTTPVSRGPEANVQPNVQPPASSPTIVSTKNLRPNGMVPLLTGQAYP
jgi:hypothetical protein